MRCDQGVHLGGTRRSPSETENSFLRIVGSHWKALNRKLKKWTSLSKQFDLSTCGRLKGVGELEAIYW